jgi:HEAT repeat protein
MPSDDLQGLLKTHFDAERAVRTTQEALLETDRAALLVAITAAVDEAWSLSDRAESNLRLYRAAELLSEFEGPKAVDLLIRILGNEDPEPRHAAGEALQGLAFDRFKEVALGIERAIDGLEVGNPALSELPYLLSEVPEPGVLKLLGRFLKHKDADAVAAAIESLVEVGDPSASSLLAPLLQDRRTVQLEDESGEEGKITLGELASEARALLSNLAASH